jgi:hypothetical protein
MERPSIVTSMILSVSALYSIGAAAPAMDPSPLLDGVGSVWGPGIPGPLLSLRPEVVPVVVGDDDTSFPSVVVAATSSGRGRIVACALGFADNDAIDRYDNKRFALNVVDWLDASRTRRVLVTRGHREWNGGDDFNSLQAALQQRGYSFTRWSGSLDAQTLADVGVVIIGTAWAPFTATEIATLDLFVNNGGGVLLMGLGWSWEPYNPGHTLDDYPMNVIGANYGIRWIDGYVTDPTNQFKGGPVFHTFFPNTGIQTLSQAFDCVSGTLAKYPNNLVQIFQGERQAKTRLDFIRSLLLLRTITAEHNTFDSLRQEICDFYAVTVATYPQYFSKRIVYDAKTQNATAWIREGLYRSFIDALPLTPERIANIASLLGLTGRYLDIWNEFSVLLLDNTSLNSRPLDFIYNLLSLVPPELHNLRAISVIDLLGTVTTPEIPLSGLEGSVNIFGVDIGGYNENSFPGDVAPGIVDGFSIVVAHELNHVVDANYISNHASLRQRRDALIAAAGTNPMNYLRSMFDPGFFANAPQEFFASISNEWFADSAKTIELGIVRLGNGICHPLEQALFFADVYSLGGNKTYFYTTDTRGNVSRLEADVIRDPQGRITLLQTEQARYDFGWSREGTVVSAASTPLVSGMEDFESGGFSKFPWQHAGTLPWFVTSDQKYAGKYSARAGAIGHGQTSTLKITGLCAAGSFSFLFKTSTEPGDKLVFKLDGQTRLTRSGESGWLKATLAIAAGVHTFEWSYVKDASASGGQDTVWLDNVVFP